MRAHSIGAAGRTGVAMTAPTFHERVVVGGVDVGLRGRPAGLGWDLLAGRKGGMSTESVVKALPAGFAERLIAGGGRSAAVRSRRRAIITWSRVVMTVPRCGRAM